MGVEAFQQRIKFLHDSPVSDWELDAAKYAQVRGLAEVEAPICAPGALKRRVAKCKAEERRAERPDCGIPGLMSDTRDGTRLE